MKTVKFAMCPICGSSCGLRVEVENGKILRVSGDPLDPHSRGYTCPKGRSLKFISEDPDRVTAPLRGNGGAWEETTWDSALDDIARRIAEIRRRHGNDAVALYAGDGTTHSYETLLSIAAFVLTLGIKNLFTANSMDALPRLFASKLIYGSSGMLPVPDVERTRHFLVIGGNPVVTNGSVMSAPGFARHIRGIRERGGKVIVVDPRKSETADLAHEHLFIRPETDVFFLLALINTVFAEGLEKTGGLKKYLTGLDELKRRAAGFTPELAARVTGIPAAKIRRIAREFAAAPSAVCYGRMGTCAQSFGVTTTMLIDALNIITGNLDRPGGAMFTTPAVDMAAVMGTLGVDGVFGKNRTRVSGLPDFNGEMPCAALAEEIEAPGGIRALIVVGGNPAVAVPDSARLTRAFAKLDLMVALDPHVNATSSHAHYILPPAVGLEHEVYPLMTCAVAVHNTAKWAPPAVAPPPGVRYDAEILRELILRVAARGIGVPQRAARALAELGGKFDGANILKTLIDFGPRGRFAFLSGATGRRTRGGADSSDDFSGEKQHGQWQGALTFDDLVKNPHGIYLGPLEPRLKQLLGPRGRVDLMPRILKDDFARIAETAEKLRREKFPPEDGSLLLTSRRQLRFFNTSLRNVKPLVGGPEQCTLQINPKDAAARGIENGGRVRVETGNGAATVAAEVTGRMMRGVVSFPFGWNGPQPKARQKVLNKNPGANVNTLTEPSRIDPVCAMSAFNGTKVWVSAARKGAPKRRT